MTDTWILRVCDPMWTGGKPCCCKTWCAGHTYRSPAKVSSGWFHIGTNNWGYICQLGGRCVALLKTQNQYFLPISSDVIIKEGDKGNPSNYRPIAILSACSKILERVVHTQVYKYLTTYSILSDAQFGFKKGHSTTTCILDLINEIYLNMNRGWISGVVFLDLKKVIDTAAIWRDCTAEGRRIADFLWRDMKIVCTIQCYCLC